MSETGYINPYESQEGFSFKHVIYPHCCKCNHPMQLLYKPYYHTQDKITHFRFMCCHDEAGNDATLSTGKEITQYPKCKCHNQMYVDIKGDHRKK